MRRREILCGGASLLLAFGTGAAADTPQDTAFDNDTVAGLARQLAAKPFKPPDSTLPKDLSDLEYPVYQSIRFKPDKALWLGGGSNFTAEFFHRGYLYKDRVDIFEVADGHATPVTYSADLFTWDKVKPPTEDLGFAGFRLQFPLNRVGLLRRDLRVPRRQLFPGPRTWPGLRIVGPRPVDQDRGQFRRGVPAVPQLLAGTPCARRRFDHGPRLARQRKRRRGVAFRHSAGPGNACSTQRQQSTRASIIAQAGLAPLTSMFFFGPNDQACRQRLARRGA